MIKSLPALLMLLALFAPPPSGYAESVAACREAGPLTVYVVRHAERQEDGTDDPGLSEAGRERAQALVSTLADVPIDAVHTTHLRRTIETATPLTGARQMAVHRWPVERGQTRAHVRSLAEVLCDHHSDARLLVVGHSNTVPQLVAALSGRSEAPMNEAEYDHFYQVRLAPDRPAEVLRVRFGAADRTHGETVRPDQSQ